MQPLCTSEEQCLYFFPHMGFRPAVHAVQRDQYGDRLTLVVGDDSPLEGKVPAGYDAYQLPFEPMALLTDAAGPLAIALASGIPGSAAGPGSWPVPVWGGGSGSPVSGSPGKGKPVVEETSSNPPEGSTGPIPPGGGPGTIPHKPGQPTTPAIEQPPSPELPPLVPVPLPDAAPMLIAALLALTLLRRVKG